jgi:hypothetical protein
MCQADLASESPNRTSCGSAPTRSLRKPRRRRRRDTERRIEPGSDTQLLRSHTCLRTSRPPLEFWPIRSTYHIYEFATLHQALHVQYNEVTPTHLGMMILIPLLLRNEVDQPLTSDGGDQVVQNEEFHLGAVSDDAYCTVTLEAVRAEYSYTLLTLR